MISILSIKWREYLEKEQKVNTVEQSAAAFEETQRQRSSGEKGKMPIIRPGSMVFPSDMREIILNAYSLFCGYDDHE